MNNALYQVGQSSKAITRRYLMDTNTSSIALLLILVDTFGYESLEWDPETIRLELQREFYAIIPSSAINKLMAAITIVTTNYFQKSLFKFNEICNVLSGDEISGGEFEPADPVEILIALTEATILWPAGQEEEEQFSDEIKAFIAEVLNDSGGYTPVGVLASVLDPSVFDEVASSWSDDPDMFSSIYKARRERVEDLQYAHKSYLRSLYNQLSALPIAQGNKDAVLHRLQQSVGGLD